MNLKLVGIEEGKEFRFKGSNMKYKLENGNLMIKSNSGWITSNKDAGCVTNLEIEPIINLTSKEIGILKGRLTEGYIWVTVTSIMEIVEPHGGIREKNVMYFHYERPIIGIKPWYSEGMSKSMYSIKNLSPDRIYSISELIKEEE